MVDKKSSASLRLRASLRADRATMHRKKFSAYRPDWNWKSMVGSAACIKWGFRDLENLDAVLKMFSGRSRVVQAGGNIGIFAKRLAEEFSEVVTFEPDASLYRALKINAPEQNIVAHRLALGACAGGVSLSSRRRDDSGRAEHEGLTHVSGDGDIQMVTVDSFNYGVCDLIYLDIEGYELNALKGAIETVRRCRPVICVEINKNIEHYGSTAAELRAFIESMGYRFVSSRNSDEAFLPLEYVK